MSAHQELIPVRPIPQKFLDPSSQSYRPHLGNFCPGGVYSGPADVNLNGKTFGYAVIRVTPKSEAFHIDGKECLPAGRSAGRVIRVNLFRSSAGWRWVKPPEAATKVLISVEAGNLHYYAASTNQIKPDRVTSFSDPYSSQP